MKLCKKCAYQNDDNARFCINCGNLMDSDKDTEKDIDSKNSQKPTSNTNNGAENTDFFDNVTFSADENESVHNSNNSNYIKADKEKTDFVCSHVLSSINSNTLIVFFILSVIATIASIFIGGNFLEYLLITISLGMFMNINQSKSLTPAPFNLLRATSIIKIIASSICLLLFVTPFLFIAKLGTIIKGELEYPYGVSSGANALSILTFPLITLIIIIFASVIILFSFQAIGFSSLSKIPNNPHTKLKFVKFSGVLYIIIGALTFLGSLLGYILSSTINSAFASIISEINLPIDSTILGIIYRSITMSLYKGFIGILSASVYLFLGDLILKINRAHSEANAIIDKNAF